MARTTNKVILVGRVGRDPEVVETEAGEVVHLSLATCRVPHDLDEDCDRTDWHRLEMRGPNLATFARERIGQHDRIYVEGALHYDSYERDGVTVPTTTVQVREVVLLRNDLESETADGGEV